MISVVFLSAVLHLPESTQQLRNPQYDTAEDHSKGGMMEKPSRFMNSATAQLGTQDDANDESAPMAEAPQQTSQKRGRVGTQESGTTDSQDNNGDNASRNNENSRRRRRMFSCESCRKSKCRCEFDSVTQSCHRCRTLRLVCSLRNRSPTPQAIQPVVEVVPDIELRVRRVEESLVEIRCALNALQGTQLRGQGVQPPPFSSQGRVDFIPSSVDYKSTRADHSLSTTEERLDYSPVDGRIGFSPAVILRQIDSQLTGYRRMFETVKSDLIHLQIIDEQTANELIGLFSSHRRHTILADDTASMVSEGTLRETSPFLHAVCCVNGFRYSKGNLAGSTLHRKVYEHVRHALGQILLASPLPIPEIFGVLIMCLFSPAPTKGPEYIDSWVLSGHCAQQAILTIDFSNLVRKIKLGDSTPADQRAIRLWANICLTHLHWAAISGRPPIIPVPYIRQCNSLLDFYEASMLDSMLVAEILLFSIFHQRVNQQLYLQSNGEWEELAKWKKDWMHVFELPTSSMVKISYYIVYLILARRSIEEIRKPARQERRGSDPSPSNRRNRSGHADSTVVSPVNRSSINNSTEDTSGPQILQSLVSKFAVLIVQTFVDMTHSLSQELPEFYYLCIAYSVLVISQYDHASELPDDTILDLVQALRNRCVDYERTPTAMAFAAERAIEKLESRLDAGDQGSATIHHRDSTTNNLWGLSFHDARSVPVDGIQSPLGMETAHAAMESSSYDVFDSFWDSFPGLTGIKF